MSYFRKASKNKQIDSIQRSSKYAQTEITFNELDINIFKERIKLLEIENDNLKKEIATLKKLSRPLNGLKGSKTLVSASPLKQNVPVFNVKHKGCTCKGNCAKKICGCMKKDLQCSETCKCNTSLCKNNKLQGSNKENCGTSKQDPPTNEARQNLEISDYLSVREKQPTESLSSVDDIFYDASDPDLENLSINLDAVRKLTFNTDEDTPEKENQLSSIQESDEESSQIQGQKDQLVKRITNNNGKVQKDRKGTSSIQVKKEQHGEGTKFNETRKKSASSKDTATNDKKQIKGSKSKRTSSVEIEAEGKILEELIENTKINSRSRKIRGASQNKEQEEIKDRKKVEKQNKNEVPEKVKPVTKNKKDVSETPNLERIRPSGLALSRESISSLKLPKNWKNVRSSVSLEKIEKVAEKENSKNLRRKNNQGNSLKAIVNKATRAASNEEISLETLQSRVRGLRRSVSSGAVASGIEANSSKDKTLQNSKLNFKSKVNEIEASRAKTLNRSMSSDILSKKPLKMLISKVSLSFRKSKLVDIKKEPSQKSQLQANLTLTNVKETRNELNDSLVSKETAEKSLKFDPMQPTRELSRSPLPAVTVSQSPETYGRHIIQQEIKVGSPPPEILQDLCEEEVDLETFHSKLVECRKCKRKFFPHRVELHEAVCHNFRKM